MMLKNTLDSENVSLPNLMEQNKNKFTNSEIKIFNYVNNNLEKLLYKSLTEVANLCNVGESTVLRFCRKLGFKGYQDFKLALARDLALIQRKDDSAEISYIGKVKQNMIQAIENTFSLIDNEQLQQAINYVKNSDNVVIYGVSSSGIAGLDMQNRLMRIGKYINVINDSHNQMIHSNSLTSGSTIIAISLTGSTKDIVDAVDNGKQRGAKIIAITNYTESPLTNYADTVLLTSAKENPLDSGSLVSKISQLFVIDLLCTGITLENYEKAQNIKQLIAKNISNKLY